MYYSEQFEKNNQKAFEPFLTGFYDEGFTISDHMRDIVRFELLYSEYIKELVDCFGYSLDLNKPYFIGFGSTAVGYFITKDDKLFVLRFIWGFNSFKSFVQSLLGQQKMEEVKLQKYIPSLYLSLYRHEPRKFSAWIFGKHEEVTRNFGIMIQDYAGETIESLKTSLIKNEKIKIAEKLKKLRSDLISANIAHEDLHGNNVLLNSNGNIMMIDLDEVKPLTSEDQLEKLDYLIKEFR